MLSFYFNQQRHGILHFAVAVIMRSLRMTWFAWEVSFVFCWPWTIGTLFLLKFFKKLKVITTWLLEENKSLMYYFQRLIQGLLLLDPFPIVTQVSHLLLAVYYQGTFVSLREEQKLRRQMLTWEAIARNSTKWLSCTKT